MRVLFINSRVDAQQNPGGDTIQVLKTREALQRLGVTVDIRGPHELEDLPAVYDIAHIFNIQEPVPAWAAFQALRKRGFPVVLSPIYWDMFAYWFERALVERARWQALARQLGMARARQLYLSWQRAKAPANPTWQLQRRLLQQAKRILPNSQSEAVKLKEFFALAGDFPPKVDVIPNAIDTDLYEQSPTPSPIFLREHGLRDFVLQVGMIYPVKNQLGLIEALYDLPVPLVFIGQVMATMSDYAVACKARAAERGKVVFIDHLPHRDLPGIYALAAVHALPSWRETPGLVSLEAAAAGCRVVTTSIGSAHDYFGDLAWYCYPNDRYSIRKAVETALDAPPSLATRQHVLNKFTWQQTATTTLASYHNALRPA